MITETEAGLQVFKAKDALSYDSVTEEFDRLTAEMTQPLAARLVALAALQPSERILDVGTGTGVVALRTAQPLESNRKVVGADLSEGMLTMAKLKARRAGLEERIQFARMDAETLGLQDGSFDVALSLFALLHFPNPLSALKEMFRVLRPGGRLILAVGSGPAVISLAGLNQGATRLRDLLLRRQQKLLLAPDFLNALVSKHIPAPNEPEESPLASHSSNRMRSVSRLVRTAGFEEVRKSWHGSDVVVDTAAKFWELQRTFSSIARKRLQGAAQHKVEAVRKDFFETCHYIQTRGGRLVYPFAAIYITAQRPTQSSCSRRFSREGSSGV